MKNSFCQPERGYFRILFQVIIYEQVVGSVETIIKGIGLFYPAT